MTSRSSSSKYVHINMESRSFVRSLYTSNSLLGRWRCVLKSTRRYRGTAGAVNGSDTPLQVFGVRRLSQTSTSSSAHGQDLSPAVRFLVGTHNIADPSAIQGTGPKSRLLKGDVLKYLEDLKTGSFKQPGLSKKPTPLVTRTRTVPVSTTPTKPSYTDAPLDSKALEAAKEAVECKRAIPLIYFTTECQLPWFRSKEVTVIQALVIKAAAEALERLPEANAIWQEDGVQRLDQVDISYHTVQDGRVTHRLISAVNRLSLKETVDALEVTNRSGTEVRGSISIFQAIESDVKESTTILHPCQSMCLYISSPQHAGLRTVSVTLSGDGRVLSQEMAAKWLQLFKSNISESSLL